MKYFKELNGQQQKIEEDLKKFVSEKNLKTVYDEEESLLTGRMEYRKSLYMQVDGFKSLASSLQGQLAVFSQVVKEGKSVSVQWNYQKGEILSYLAALKEDLQEQKEFLLTEEADFPISFLEIPSSENDFFIENLPIDIPG